MAVRCTRCFKYNYLVLIRCARCSDPDTHRNVDAEDPDFNTLTSTQTSELLSNFSSTDGTASLNCSSTIEASNSGDTDDFGTRARQIFEMLDDDRDGTLVISVALERLFFFSLF